jgi:hypothetical protein
VTRTHPVRSALSSCASGTGGPATSREGSRASRMSRTRQYPCEPALRMSRMRPVCRAGPPAWCCPSRAGPANPLKRSSLPWRRPPRCRSAELARRCTATSLGACASLCERFTAPFPGVARRIAPAARARTQGPALLRRTTTTRSRRACDAGRLLPHVRRKGLLHVLVAERADHRVLRVQRAVGP